MIYPKEFESKIGFDSIRNILNSYCNSSLGSSEVEKMTFETSFAVITHKLRSVNEMTEIIRENLNFPLPQATDIISILSELKIPNSFVGAEKLYKLLTVLELFAHTSNFFKRFGPESGDNQRFVNLREDVSSLIVFPELFSRLNSIVNKFGEVKDTASPALGEIRRQIRQAGASVQKVMRRLVDYAVANGIIDKDTSPSIRDGRLVIPVAAGNKKLISGIVHDESATGKTVYIEPVEVLEASNRLRELEIEEHREITRILISAADEIRPHIDDIAGSCEIIGLLDFIHAKARLAIELDASLPNIGEKPEIEWYHAKHPVLELTLSKAGREVVPLDITLSEDKRILVISGPNAGGKSVCLKTVAIVQYMMQCGLLPTLYDNSHMGVFRNVFIDIGDEQSIENDLSTYSSHLKNMRFFLQHSDRKTLFLADEMGGGTEPAIGAAIAQAILVQLSQTGCYGIVTTHYQNLKSLAETVPGFVNGAMLYDRSKLQPTFQLSIGNPGSSFALDIAHKMGLPRNVIENAKEIVGEEYVNLDKYLSDIARDRKYWANKRLNIKEKEHKLDNLLERYEDLAGDLKSQRNAIISDARKEAKEILDEANARIERTISEIRKVQAEKEKTKQLRSELNDFKIENEEKGREDVTPRQVIKIRHKSNKSRNQSESAKTVPIKKEIAKGDSVLLDNGKTVGTVISVNGKNAEVIFGSLRTVVKISRLTLTEKPKAKIQDFVSTVSAETLDSSRKRQLNFKDEIDVRGMRADEALQAVTYFIDDAIQFGIDKVRILHGTGHGILKTLIRQQLKGNNNIQSFYDEDVRLGGAGITVVELA